LKVYEQSPFREEDITAQMDTIRIPVPADFAPGRESVQELEAASAGVRKHALVSAVVRLLGAGFLAGMGSIFNPWDLTRRPLFRIESSICVFLVTSKTLHESIPPMAAALPAARSLGWSRWLASGIMFYYLSKVQSPN